LADAYIGAYIFVTEREENLSQYLPWVGKRVQRPIAPSNPDNDDGNGDNSFHKI